jgi:SPP1 gp7 family putative phage head morphogenesis protein
LPALTQHAAIQKMLDSSDDALTQSTDDYVDDLLSKWTEFQGRLENDIMMIRSRLPEKVTYSDFVRFQGDAKIEGAIAEQLKRLHVSVEQDRIDSLIAQYKDAYNVSAYAIDESTPPEVDITYNLASDDQIKMFVSADWGDNMFVTRNAKEFYFLAQDIKKEVTLAMLQGQSVQQLSKAIQGVIGDEDSDYKYRSTRIARTELLRAANIARNHLYDQNDELISKRIWVTRALGDGRLCEDCAERAGKTYDEVEEIADEQEMEVDPPIHPACGCTWMAVPKNPSEFLSPELSKGIKDFDTDNVKYNPPSYKSWADDYLTTAERGNL